MPDAKNVVQAHFSGYAFHITNPDDVLRGAKPKLEERGPYVYLADTVKDSEGMIWSDDSADLTYRDDQKGGPGVGSVISDLSGLAGDFTQGCQMAKFDPFLSLDCARVEGLGAQGGGREGAIQGKEGIKSCCVA